MKHKEWLGKKELVKRLLKKSGLYIVDKRNTIKLTMRCIIWFRYIDLMSVEETITKLWLDYGIELSYSRGNYNAGQDGMKALENTMELFTEFTQKMIQEAETPEEKQIIKKYLRKVSQMG